jgi:hypothetical protein
MGVGDHAGDHAGGTYREGQLYYLFIKPDSDQIIENSEQGDTKSLKSKGK